MTVRSGRPVDENGVCEHQDELDKLGKEIAKLLKEERAVDEDANLDAAEKSTKMIAIANEVAAKRDRVSELNTICQY